MKLVSANDILLNDHLKDIVVLARRSDCKEAQYGAVIFKGGVLLGIGFNHVPTILKEKYVCGGSQIKQDCPRRQFPELRGGVGMDLCIATHAEEAAIIDMYQSRGHNLASTRGATMLIGKLKDGAVKVHDYPVKLTCTKCSGKIANETQLEKIAFLTTNGFAIYGREELHEETIKSLRRSYQEAVAAQPL